MRCGTYVSALIALGVSMSFASASAQTVGQTSGLSGRVLPPDAATGFVSPATTPQTAPAQTGEQQTNDPWRSFAPVSPGVVAGPWTFFPALTSGAYYDDNVFATHSNRQSDWAGFVRPEIGARTSGQNYAFEGRGYVEQRWYSRFKSEDQLNAGAAVNTTVMPDKDTQVVAKAGYVRGHQERGTGETLIINGTNNGTVFTGFDRPLAFNLFEASGAINKRFDRWWTSLGAAGSWTDYDTPTINGIPQSVAYMNGVVSVVSGRVGYVVAPLTSVFIEGAGNRRHFDVDAFDSRGYRVVGGVLLEQGPGAKVRGEAFAGYMHQDYSGFGFDDVSTFTYGGALAYLIAPQWTAVVEGRRNALESGLQVPGRGLGVSVIESELGGRIDYQILPNLTIGAGASWLQDQFLGAGRTDTSISPLASIKYVVSPHLLLGFDYRNVSFDSSGTGVLTYYRNVYLFSIRAQI